MNQSTSFDTLVGSFTWDVDQDRWWWSDELYRIHGFEPGEVIPSSDLWLAHKHPDDLDKVKYVVEGAIVQRGRFGCYHRILDARRREHHVLLAGSTRRDPAGTSVQLHGFLADLTAARRDDLQPAIDEAIGEVMVNRASIEQAKGALMMAHGIGPDAAFALLSTTSQTGNIKVHDLAERFVARLRAEADVPLDHARVDSLLAEAAGPDV